MNLCADIGNTRVKIGLFQDKKLLEQAVWTDWTIDHLINFGKQAEVQKVIFSSVAQPDPELMRQLKNHFKVMELTTETPLPFENRYTTPHTQGKDRLAAVAGAQALFPGENCCVIDCGTCIKYELLLATGIYLGGNIAPGAHMRLMAMHHFTARLPEVPMEMPGDIWGDSTKTAMQNGALRGAALEMEGFIRLFEQQYTPLRVVMTGGDAAFFQPFLTFTKESTVPELTLHGLNNILIFNT
jgi:type III pantothenate kinase